MAVQSKLIKCSCQEYIHPWTASCVNGAAGILLSSAPSSMRTYCIVYLLALVMKMRIPRLLDIKHTIIGILTSSAFLTTNAYLFSLMVCVVRRLVGGFHLSTVAFIPTFIASFAALCIERPARRTPLALYVANEGTEALWNMLEAHGLVRSIPNGQVLILGCSLTALLYMYRRGVHKSKVKDVTFKALAVLMAKGEEGPIKPTEVVPKQTSSRPPLNLRSISAYVQLYDRLRNRKHPSCPHREGCGTYVLLGGLKPLLGGVGLQVGLKLLLNIGRIVKLKMDWRKQIFNRNSLQLGLALGSFSLIFKAVSCGLRNACGYDAAYFAIPAGLLGSIGLLQYPNITISLYVMWKALQMLYNWGSEENVLPKVPHFNMVLYASFTAVLFHCAILEASSIRNSYYKFLVNISGRRINLFDRRPFQSLGLKSHDRLQEVIKRLKMDMTNPLPIMPLTV
ncbi:PREDICTED: transmembrane protein 135-like [Drosophila arizonae]|uniref:Transmembrane protein 135-like n=1 Tax=Drosophila arizonae TaxID=7263 RepID=A0ABM1NMJ0_DROAR|nr:PREDICTED: transmembrane protein 135-like [Drosophila arizonae]